MKSGINCLCFCPTVHMERHQVVQAMLTTGKTLSIGVDELRTLLLKLIVLSVKYVSKRDVWRARFGDDYTDWDLVEAVHGGKNLFGGCAEWLGLLEFCSWEELAKQEAGVTPLVRAVRKHLRECNLDTGDATGWTLACKIFLLMLLQGVSSLHALEMLTCQIFKANTQGGCMMLLAKQAENLYTPAQYEEALQYVLEKCAVDSTTLEQTQLLMQAAADDRKVCLKMSRMTVVQGRPRLRDRVTSELRTDEKKTQMDAKLETWDSYTGFCWKHQFPPTLSEKIRSKLYFLACQTRFEWGQYVEAVLPTGGALCSRVASFPVAQPDLPVILRVIERLSMDGSPPFKEMTDFRKECFQSFPVTHVQRMTLSQVSRSLPRIRWSPRTSPGHRRTRRSTRKRESAYALGV